MSCRTGYSGSGIGGALLYSATVNVAVGAGQVPVSGVNVVAGQQYTMTFSSPVSGWFLRCNTGDPYPSGTAGNSGGVLTGLDWEFQTFFTSGNPVVVTDSGRVGVGTQSPSASVDVAHGGIRIREPSSPTSTSTCQQGEIRWDASFVYVCVQTDVWRRAVLAAY